MPISFLKILMKFRENSFIISMDKFAIAMRIYQSNVHQNLSLVIMTQCFPEDFNHVWGPL